MFTIHNLNYGAELIGRAMAAASVATTVSPTYSKEISGHPAVAPHLGKMFGVRNGVDVDIWDPSADPFLPVRFDADSFDEGKARLPSPCACCNTHPSCIPVMHIYHACGRRGPHQTASVQQAIATQFVPGGVCDGDACACRRRRSGSCGSA